jgi:hypothetical protein
MAIAPVSSAENGTSHAPETRAISRMPGLSRP